MLSAICAMLHVTAALTSGRSAGLSISQSSKVGDLKALAQKSFGIRFLTLVTSKSRILLDPVEPLQTAGLADGDQLTAVVGQAKLAATSSAFAFWSSAGDRVVTWGEPGEGGDSSAVQDKLKIVRQVQATWTAFAAVLEEGSVVTWGSPHGGGDSSALW